MTGKRIVDDMMRDRKPPSDPKTPYAAKNIFRLSCSYFLPQMILLRYNTPKMQPLWNQFMKPMPKAPPDDSKNT